MNLLTLGADRPPIFSTPRTQTPGQGGASFDSVLDSVSPSRTEAPSGDLPLEAFALPDWYVSLVPGGAIPLDMNVARFSNRLTRDGEMSDQDRAALDAFRRNDPAHQAMLRYRRYQQAHAREIGEYQKILDRVFKKALEDHGITDFRSYYENLILNPETNASVQGAVRAELEADSRFMELMGELGTSF